MEEEQEEKLLSIHHGHDLLLRIHLLASQARKEKPDKYMDKVCPIVRESLEIMLKVYRRAGVTSGQLKQLEQHIDNLEQLIA